MSRMRKLPQCLRVSEMVLYAPALPRVTPPPKEITPSTPAQIGAAILADSDMLAVIKRRTEAEGVRATMIPSPVDLSRPSTARTPSFRSQTYQQTPTGTVVATDSGLTFSIRHLPSSRLLNRKPWVKPALT